MYFTEHTKSKIFSFQHEHNIKIIEILLTYILVIGLKLGADIALTAHFSEVQPHEPGYFRIGQGGSGLS